MKSEKRHNLETNELAKRLAGWIENSRSHSGYVIGFVGILLGLMLVSSVWSSRSASRREAAWDAYALAINSSDMEMQNLQRLSMDDSYAGTQMPEWASVTWADRQLLLAVNSYLYDRESTKERLKQAEAAFYNLATLATDMAVKDRARFGLARIYELRGELDKARQQYALVEGDFATLAEQQTERLAEPAVQADYQWLATAKIQPRMPATGPGTPGSRPNFEAAPPATDGGKAINVKTLEELLGDLSRPADEDRYGQDESAEEKPSEANSEDAGSEDANSEDTGEAAEQEATVKDIVKDTVEDTVEE